MKSISLIILKILFLLSLVLILSGCVTTAGFFIGKSADNRKSPVNVTLQNSELDQLKKGYKIEVYLINGRVYKGHFQSLETPTYMYATQFLVFENRSGKTIKLQDDSIQKVEVKAEKRFARYMVAGIGFIIDIVFLMTCCAGG